MLLEDKDLIFTVLLSLSKYRAVSIVRKGERQEREEGGEEEGREEEG